MIISELKFDKCLDLYGYLLKSKVPKSCRAYKKTNNTYVIYFLDKFGAMYDSFTLNDEYEIYALNHYLKCYKLPSMQEIVFNE